MGRLFKRNGIYYADVRGEGFGRPTLKTADRTVAKARLRDAELGKLWGATPTAPQGGSKPLAIAIDEMLALKGAATASCYRGHAQALLRHFGHRAVLADVTRASVSAFITVQRTATIKPHTIQKRLVVLRQALLEAKARKEYVGDIADLVPSFKSEYQPVTRWLSPAQFSALLALAPTHRRSWLMLQVFTSSNRSETARLTWEHVDLEQRVVTVPGTKRNSRLRIVPIHDTL